MLKKKLKLLKNQTGLTLVELLAVIVILGVIAAIAVPAIGGVIASSKTNADVQAEILLRDTAVRYMYDVDPDGNGLLANGTTAVPGYTAGTPGSITVAQLIAANYLKATPKRQSTNTAYLTVPITYAAATGWTSNDGALTP